MVLYTISLKEIQSELYDEEWTDDDYKKLSSAENPIAGVKAFFYDAKNGVYFHRQYFLDYHYPSFKSEPTKSPKPDKDDSTPTSKKITRQKLVLVKASGETSDEHDIIDDDYIQDVANDYAILEANAKVYPSYLKECLYEEWKKIFENIDTQIQTISTREQVEKYITDIQNWIWRIFLKWQGSQYAKEYPNVSVFFYRLIEVITKTYTVYINENTNKAINVTLNEMLKYRPDIRDAESVKILEYKINGKNEKSGKPLTILENSEATKTALKALYNFKIGTSAYMIHQGRVSEDDFIKAFTVSGRGEKIHINGQQKQFLYLMRQFLLKYKHPNLHNPLKELLIRHEIHTNDKLQERYNAWESAISKGDKVRWKDLRDKTKIDEFLRKLT